MRTRSLLLALSLLISCTPRPVPPKNENPADGLPLAMVGNFLITEKYFLDQIEKAEAKFPKKFTELPQRRSLLEEMMKIELLAEEAKKLHLEETPEFKARLVDLYVQKLSEKAKQEVTEEAIAAYYEENRKLIDQVAARHILYKFPPNVSRKERTELKEKMTKLRNELLKNPESFPEVAKKESQDGSASQGGELGYFSFDMMVRPFSKAAFALKKPGDISEIVESQYGFHLIQLTGERRRLEDYKDRIRQELLRQHQSRLFTEEVNRLSAGKKFEIYDENLRKVSPLQESFTKDPDELIEMNKR